MPRVSRTLLALTAAAAAFALAPATRAEHSASAAVYVRDDTDRTTVISPRLRLRSELAEQTHLDASYAVDVWTSASVDIIASASQPVTEQRDELNVGVDQVLGDVTVALAYRLSLEPDYESHGGSASGVLALADNATLLSLSLAGSTDRVGRAGDPSFAEDVDTLTTTASVTQVVDPDMLVQVLYELGIVRGYQASAYRFVPIGGDGQCFGVSPFCRPEQNPRERMRHALALRARRALGRPFSLGAGYRAYLDDWGIVSHTVTADLAWAPDPLSTVALAYRFYDQGAADHYQPFYLQTNPVFFTRDKELSPLSSHRAALELHRVWELAGGEGLVTGLEIAPTFYLYHDYPSLDRVTAIEVSAVAGMEFE